MPPTTTDFPHEGAPTAHVCARTIGWRSMVTMCALNVAGDRGMSPNGGTYKPMPGRNGVPALTLCACCRRTVTVT
eukprot:2651164-Rhodomonas_salina.2